MTIFLRLIDELVEDKPKILRKIIIKLALQKTNVPQAFEKDHRTFSEVPGSPFAYWVSDAIRRCFITSQRTRFVAKLGLKTDDDFRFIRLWYEVPSGGTNYRPLAKGGAYCPVYGDIHLLLKWQAEGWELKSLSTERWGNAGKRIFNESFYFRPGLTWPRRTTSGFGIRAMPAGCIFADKGPAAFVDADNPSLLLALSAILNSAPYRYLVGVQLAAADAAARSYEVGIVQQTPVPALSDERVDTLAKVALRTWSLKRTLDTSDETSHAFLLPPGPNEKVSRFSRDIVLRELDEMQSKINDASFELYSFSGDDRASIEAADNFVPPKEESAQDEDADNEEMCRAIAHEGTLLSWLVGVAFGRFDKRLATGERPIPKEPRPFDPLPSRSPGMWPEGESRLIIPPEILVDDAGHDHDLAAHVTNASANTGWSDPEDLRQWLAHEFFLLHIKMYSKSRRKAPIYWQLATPSAGYSVWLYIHAFTKDTLYKVQNEYTGPKLALEERKLESLRRELGESPKPANRKTLAGQESLVEELRAFLEEVKRVAPLWNPDLDDGVIVNFAPLWRLVPHHKPWQKELKASWDGLCDGDYDWAHLAMHLWPERVVPKCATDRSLAIAHGLEDIFWSEGTDGKWKPRGTPTRSIEELVHKRSSPAVKAALKSLLGAPTASGANQGRSRRGATKKVSG